MSTADKESVVGVRISNKVGGIWSKALSGILALTILGALSALAYSVAKPFEEPFTEFYLLGLSGEAKDYPSLLSVGEEGRVVVGIGNREYETVSYRLEVRIEGIISSKVGQVTLKHKEKWQEIVSFTPNRVGDKQKVEFLLYRQGKSDVYQSLHLRVDVQ